jgi:hypothetical protein
MSGDSPNSYAGPVSIEPVGQAYVFVGEEVLYTMMSSKGSLALLLNPKKVIYPTMLKPLKSNQRLIILYGKRNLEDRRL